MLQFMIYYNNIRKYIIIRTNGYHIIFHSESFFDPDDLS